MNVHRKPWMLRAFIINGLTRPAVSGEGFLPDTIALRKARGHAIDESSGAVSSVVEMIVNDQGWLQGAADGRRPGKAAGY